MGEDSSRLFIGVLFFKRIRKGRCSRVKDALEPGQAAEEETRQERWTALATVKQSGETNGRDVQDAASYSSGLTPRAMY
jgi:hypothetical protein